MFEALFTKVSEVRSALQNSNFQMTWGHGEKVN